MQSFGRTQVVTGLIWLLTGSIAGAQVASATGFGGRITTALRFMYELYDEPREGTDRFQIEGRLSSDIDIREFGVQLGPNELHKLRTPGELAHSRCYATFVFSPSGLWSYFGNGECVKEAENAALQASLASNPRWTDDQISRELSRRGALFGPTARDDIKARIPAIGLVSDTIGELVELRTIEFNMPDRLDGQIQATDAPSWRVTFDVLGKPRVTVVLVLEPFDGRVKRMVRLPPE